MILSLLLYVDDVLIVGHDESKIEELKKELQDFCHERLWDQ